MRALRAFGFAAAALWLAAAAPDPAERLTDPGQEARARALFQEIRCVVCQNESIDDSEADLAGDLRRIIRHQVRDGRSDAEIRRFLVERYGEFVLLKPSFSLSNLILWLAPPAVLAGVGVALFLQRRRREDVAELTPEEEAKVAALAAANGSGAVPPENGQNKTLADDAKVT
jgi:cytochrome c-type biogenesis protein CcmH